MVIIVGILERSRNGNGRLLEMRLLALRGGEADEEGAGSVGVKARR